MLQRGCSSLCRNRLLSWNHGILLRTNARPRMFLKIADIGDVSDVIGPNEIKLATRLQFNLNTKVFKNS